MEVLKQTLDRKLVKYLLLFIFLSFMVSTVSTVIGKWEGIAYNTLSWKELFASLVVRYISKLTFIFSAIVLVRYLFLKNFITRWMSAILHFIFALGLTFYSIYIQVLASNWFMGGADEVSWEYVYSRALLGTDYNFFLYFCMIAIVYAYYFFKKQRDFELKESNLKSQLLNSKMNALQAQLQPHFLFNALNDISSLVDESPEKAQDVIADLSDMLRKTLSLTNVKFVSLFEEIELLKKYLNIEKVRFQDKLDFKIEVSEDLFNKDVPPLLLQPIAENAIKHGYSYEHDTLLIEINISENDNYLEFLISNNGSPLPKGNSTYGIGLSNIISRMNTLYEGNFVFEMANKTNKEVCVILKIPSKS